MLRSILFALCSCSSLLVISPATANDAATDAIATATAAPVAEFNPAATSEQTAIDPETFAGFSQWDEVKAFIDRMVNKHDFARTELESQFADAELAERAIRLMMPAPPGRPKGWRAYRERFVEPVRIKAGVEFWNQHQDALALAEKVFGVPADIIVGIIGVETIYGRYTGNFRTLDAIATLAFAYPDTPNRASRMRYFRGELENLLLFARESRIDPFSLRGSYAGAIGWPQFMPGSIRKYAVDFDGDGLIDLRNSPVDAIGSVANFLLQHGWKKGEPLVFPAQVADDNKEWQAFIGQGLEAKFRLEDMKAAGVTPSVEPPDDMLFSLVDLQNGEAPTEYWLGANNFFSITLYNRSYFYAMSVIELGRAVRSMRGR